MSYQKVRLSSQTRRTVVSTRNGFQPAPILTPSLGVGNLTASQVHTVLVGCIPVTGPGMLGGVGVGGVGVGGGAGGVGGGAAAAAAAAAAAVAAALDTHKNVGGEEEDEAAAQAAQAVQAAQAAAKAAAEEEARAAEEVVRLAEERAAEVAAERREAGERMDPEFCRLVREATVSELINPESAPLVRGMINDGNYCYIHSVLQALAAVPVFYDMVAQLLGAYETIDHETSPAAYAFISLVYDIINAEHGPGLTVAIEKSKRKRSGQAGGGGGGDKPDSGVRKIQLGKPYVPDYFYGVASLFVARSFNDTTGSSVSKQQDCQEWFNFLMESLHDEFLAAAHTAPPASGGLGGGGFYGAQDADDGWSEVGRGGKATSISHTADLGSTPVTDIFGGTIRSSVSSASSKTNATLQPFTVLPLDIRDADTIREALECEMNSEYITDYIDPETGTQCAVRKTVSFEKLPRVLVLHLKRFTYSHSGTRKITKAVSFPEKLTIPAQLISNALSSKTMVREYTLRAGIEHLGVSTGNGHYITHAVHSTGAWLQFDDKDIKATAKCQIDPESVYMLFYEKVHPSQTKAALKAKANALASAGASGLAGVGGSGGSASGLGSANKPSALGSSPWAR